MTEERSAAQIEAGWGGSYSPKGRKAAEAIGFSPGVKKARGRKVRRNPALRLELQGSQWMVQLSTNGQWWPATDAEVELWLRLGEKV